MIKVLHIITGLEQGGAETMLYKLLCSINHNRFESIVVSMMDEGVFGPKIKTLGIPVYSLNMRGYGLQNLKAILLYRKIIKTHRPDVIQAWMYHANVFGFLASRFSCPFKFFMNIRDSLAFYHSSKITTQMVIRLNALLSRFADCVVNNSISSQEQHVQIGFSKENNVVVPNGFDLQLFRFSNIYSIDFRQKYKIPNDTKILGMFSRFHPQKNHIGFCDVAQELIRRGNHRWIFVLAGRGCDEENSSLMKIISDYKLNDNIILLGSVNSEKYLSCLDVYLSTSNSEGFPNIIGEAMACGVSCVVTDVGDCEKIVANHGYVTKTNDIESQAYICEMALKKTEDEKSAMRSHIEKNYAIEKIALQYENLYG